MNTDTLIYSITSKFNIHTSDGNVVFSRSSLENIKELNSEQIKLLIEIFDNHNQQQSIQTHSANKFSYQELDNKLTEVCLGILIDDYEAHQLSKNQLNEITNLLDNYATLITEREDLEAMKSVLSYYEHFTLKHPTGDRILDGKVGGKLGVMYHYLGKTKDAQALLEKSLDQLNSNYEENKFDIAYLLLNLGNANRALAKKDGIEEHLLKSLEIYNLEPQKYQLKIADVLANLGITYREKADYSKAREYFELALPVYQELLPEDHNKLGWASTNLGIICKNLKEFDRAIPLLEKGLSIYKKHFDSEGGRVAWASAWLGNTYMLAGKTQDSISTLEESVALYEKFYGKEHIGYAQALFFLGDAYLAAGDFLKAKNVLEESLSIHKKLLADPLSPKIERVSSSLNKALAELGT